MKIIDRYLIRENRPVGKIRDKLLTHALHYGDLMPAPVKQRAASR